MNCTTNRKRQFANINDPNRRDAPEYIVKLIKKVVTVSLETVEIVEGLPKIDNTEST